MTMNCKVLLALLVCSVAVAHVSASALGTGVFDVLKKDHGGYTSDDSNRRLLGVSSTTAATASCR